MKAKKRVLNLVMAFVLLMTTFLPAIANAQTDPHKTDVVITKVGLESLTGWPKGGGTDAYNGGQITDMNTYFGTHTVMKGVAFRVYVGTDASGTEVAGGPFITGENGQVTIPNLADGTYYFVEDKAASTYVGQNGEVLNEAAAVPFTLTLPVYKADGTMFGTGDNALFVYPKNTDEKPQIDKNFKDPGANYANTYADKGEKSYTVGDSVPYQVKTQIPKGATYKTLTWTDTMSKGLTYNKDLVISASGGLSFDAATDYTITNTVTGFVLDFTAAGLTKLEAAAKTAAIDITLEYSATLNEDAVVQVPEKNSVTLKYGNNPKAGNTPPDVKPDNSQISLTKTWADGTAPTGASAIFDVIDKTTNKLVETITLNAGNNWAATITGLDNTHTYNVVERAISGYAPEYTSTANGVLTVKNVKDNNPTITPTAPKVVTGGKKFEKVDGTNYSKKLAGAEFIVVKGTEFLALKDTTEQANAITTYNNAEASYQAAIKALNDEKAKPLADQNAGTITMLEGDANTTGSILNLKAARDAAFVAMNTQWKWVSAEGEAFKFTSDANGKFEVVGLAYGDYQLKETKAPAGYANITANIPFTVNATSYNTTADPVDFVLSAANEQIIKNNKVTIPQTGGIGSIIFVLAGVGIMASTIIIKKRRNADNA